MQGHLYLGLELLKSLICPQLLATGSISSATIIYMLSVDTVYCVTQHALVNVTVSECVCMYCNLMISWIQFAVDILIQETQSCIRQGYVLGVGLFTVMCF